VVLAIGIAVLSIGSAAPARALTGEEIGAIPVDLILLRPLGAIRLIVGSVYYLPAALVTSPSAAYDGDTAEIDALTETFVNEPFDYLFLRPLGKDLAGR
jgi:hypothetical protein